MGRNPKTGEAVPILPRRVLLFKASKILKQHINGAKSITGDDLMASRA
jgi:integration host factor subunit alpha